MGLHGWAEPLYSVGRHVRLHTAIEDRALERCGELGGEVNRRHNELGALRLHALELLARLLLYPRSLRRLEGNLVLGTVGVGGVFVLHDVAGDGEHRREEERDHCARARPVVGDVSEATRRTCAMDA
jgi:hypothetical protein